MITQLPYPPSCNRAWRMANGRMVQPQAVRDWKRNAAWTARASGMTPLAGSVRVAVTVHPRMTCTGKASARRIDADNALKLTLDALQGVAYADDRQVVAVSSTIGLPLPDGGLTVEVEAMNASRDAQDGRRGAGESGAPADQAPAQRPAEAPVETGDLCHEG